ncbi:hypothetical protein PHYSODRAFT_342434 [Phytophthora sojae]|uniref:1,3-beta-glucanosyltransferase n=1 Tax=Phytophthora sojae (strain P6497) TaxID=1094619 RepID=G5AGH9_PHYSP|nr:hypothetical protein PHYSODRAFT_342434 [Phytophthora sojae]EGZ05259.1 hypothetical protein PHYSODRAFT_342434 [Phytophthora sojae]|eukprot:XP_009539180.1 hypothetical protein PHYSODRAFT_342434 [Phytophthora sojae]
MAFGSRIRGLCAAAALATAVVVSPADAWVAPIITKGNKFFNSETGMEFRMAYYPRPNSGEMADVSNYDWAADEHEAVWKPHLEVMKDLGVNTIRLYSVDPSKSHDKFMCENCSVLDFKPPKCYPDDLFTRADGLQRLRGVRQHARLQCNNLQVKNGAAGTTTAPCVKAFLRDTRSYAASCSGSVRQVPIGLDIADIPPREQWISYYDCAIDDDENTRAEWMGFNPYVEVDLKKLMSEYAEVGYAHPLMFGEFGCNKGKNTVEGYKNQRSFLDAKWMNEEKEMTDEIVGGNVFEFTTEIANLVESKTLTKTGDAGKYGVGYFMSEDCDNELTECVFTPYPEYDNLKKAYTTTKNSTVEHDSYTPTRTAILECSKNISSKLPPTPKVPVLECTITQPVCNGIKGNSYEHHSTGAAVGEKRTPTNEESSSASITDATTGSSGASATASAAAFVLSVATVAATAMSLF